VCAPNCAMIASTSVEVPYEADCSKYRVATVHGAWWICDSVPARAAAAQPIVLSPPCDGLGLAALTAAVAAAPMVVWMASVGAPSPVSAPALAPIRTVKSLRVVAVTS
jgi:hypothetical protein